MLMLPSYITRLPDGHEAGDVYAIDLGGTNFRVMRAQLSDARSEMVRFRFQEWNECILCAVWTHTHAD